FVEGSEPREMHEKMAHTLDAVLDRIRTIQDEARGGEPVTRARWPMIVLRSPKGWTGPKEVDGKKVEGFWRARQVPVEAGRSNHAHLEILENWMRSYRPDALFDQSGQLNAELQASAPVGSRRMGANPHANGGTLKRKLELPDHRNYAVRFPSPGRDTSEATRIVGSYLRDVIGMNAEARTFRLMGPDETESNRLGAVFEVTDR